MLTGAESIASGISFFIKKYLIYLFIDIDRIVSCLIVLKVEGLKHFGQP
jgi:hypothetical protein